MFCPSILFSHNQLVFRRTATRQEPTTASPHISPSCCVFMTHLHAASLWLLAMNHVCIQAVLSAGQNRFNKNTCCQMNQMRWTALRRWTMLQVLPRSCPHAPCEQWKLEVTRRLNPQLTAWNWQKCLPVCWSGDYSGSWEMKNRITVHWHFVD